MRSISAFFAGASAIVFTASLMSSAVAADYPEKPVTMIVNAGAGGSTSGGARILAKAMESTLGQPIVVVSKPGGSGTKGAVLVIDDDPLSLRLLTKVLENADCSVATADSAIGATERVLIEDFDAPT